MLNPCCQRPCYTDHRTPLHRSTSSLQQIDLILFDMDGVLTDIVSSWQYVHEYFQTSNERSVQAYMNGDISDEEFIRRDVSLWKKDGRLITYQQLHRLLDDIPLMNGAHTLFSFLHKHHIQTAIVSAGLDILAEKVAETLQIPYVYANGLSVDERKQLTGEGILRVKLMYKDEAVRAIGKELNIDVRSMASVGNSCFDIPMLAQTGLGIAFNPNDDCIIKEADIVVKEKNLAQLIPIFQRYMK